VVRRGYVPTDEKKNKEYEEPHKGILDGNKKALSAW
jgi:hypothetical protein